MKILQKTIRLSYIFFHLKIALSKDSINFKTIVVQEDCPFTLKKDTSLCSRKIV